MSKVAQLIDRLEVFHPTVMLANPYRQWDSPEDRPNGAAIRRANLSAYLLAMQTLNPPLILLGEAAGYQGCRFSGMAFTSEYTLLNHPFFAKLNVERSSSRERPWREPSGTMVWETIGLMGTAALLWNILPFHPHRIGEPLSNRTPTPDERKLGLEFFQELREIFPLAQVITVGRISEEILNGANIPNHTVRHPANGGKTAFQAGVLKFVKDRPFAQCAKNV